MSEPDEPVVHGQLLGGDTPLHDISPEVSDNGSNVDAGETNEKTLNTLEKEINEGKWDSDTKNPTLRDEFRKQHEETVWKKNHLDSNIFHVLAKLEDRRLTKLKLLVYWTVELCARLLSDPDKQGQTGLHTAIQLRNFRMLRYVMDAYDKYAKRGERDLDEILKIPCSNLNGNNSVHLAMKWMTPVRQNDGSQSLRVILSLIEKSRPETLCMQNNDGLTPLHLAVEGQKCTVRQVEIVRKLIETCEGALDVGTYQGKRLPSVYQHHRATYEKWKTKSEQADPRNSSHGKSKSKMDPDYGKPDGRSSKHTEERAQPENTGTSASRTDEKPTGGSGQSTFDSRQKPSEGGSSRLHIPKPSEGKPGLHMEDGNSSRDRKPYSGNLWNAESNMGKPRRQSTMPIGKKIPGPNDASGREQRQRPSIPLSGVGAENNQSPHSPRPPTEQKESNSQKESTSDKVTAKSAGEIARHLKHTYLRNRSRPKALDFLYGGELEKQIDFNLYGKEGEICEKDFKAGYKCANLEDMLQRVHIPHLVIKPTAVSQSAATEQMVNQQVKLPEPTPTQSSRTGRTDLGIIFSWLREDAHVDKIIKLVVDDSHHPPHSDEAIERAVKPFNIEIWDWQKIDMCCETIAEAAPAACYVNLYWSGNNAVLRGWSDPEGGLARLPYLKKVVVFAQAGIEGNDRNLRNFETFKERLKRHAKRKDIEVTLDNSSTQEQTRRSLRARNGEELQRHRWLKCMGNFARVIVNARLKDPRLLKPIKIAIIDDGIDTTERKLHDRIVGGQCFCADDESPSFCVSSGGHGTVMARLITRIFPLAQIYCLKLDEHPQSDGTVQFSVTSAAKAIRWARAAGVSIINMSWSIEKTDANKNDLDDLERAINKADESKILMFCSANDQGKTTDASYPGAIKRKTLYKIGAATATGAECPYVSLPDVDFLFPGRVVEHEQDEAGAAVAAGGYSNTNSATAGSPRDRSSEGSSIATAFASGLAGVILCILQLTSIYFADDDENPVAKHYEIVRKDPEKMKRIFERLESPEKRFVEVWKVFEDAHERWRTGGRHKDNTFKILSDVCSSLVTARDMS